MTSRVECELYLDPGHELGELPPLLPQAPRHILRDLHRTEEGSRILEQSYKERGNRDMLLS
jgi:hypothetical protein